MNEIEQYKYNVERAMMRRGRIVTNWWGNEPVHRPMTPYEKFAAQQRSAGHEVIDEATFNLGIGMLGSRDASKFLVSINPKQ